MRAAEWPATLGARTTFGFKLRYRGCCTSYWKWDQTNRLLLWRRTSSATYDLARLDRSANWIQVEIACQTVARLRRIIP